MKRPPAATAWRRTGSRTLFRRTPPAKINVDFMADLRAPVKTVIHLSFVRSCLTAVQNAWKNPPSNFSPKLLIAVGADSREHTYSRIDNDLARQGAGLDTLRAKARVDQAALLTVEDNRVAVFSDASLLTRFWSERIGACALSVDDVEAAHIQAFCLSDDILGHPFRPMHDLGLSYCHGVGGNLACGVIYFAGHGTRGGEVSYGDLHRTARDDASRPATHVDDSPSSGLVGVIAHALHDAVLQLNFQADEDYGGHWVVTPRHEFRNQRTIHSYYHLMAQFLTTCLWAGLQRTEPLDVQSDFLVGRRLHVIADACYSGGWVKLHELLAQFAASSRPFPFDAQRDSGIYCGTDSFNTNRIFPYLQQYAGGEDPGVVNAAMSELARYALQHNSIVVDASCGPTELARGRYFCPALIDKWQATVRPNQRYFEQVVELEADLQVSQTPERAELIVLPEVVERYPNLYKDIRQFQSRCEAWRLPAVTADSKLLERSDTRMQCFGIAKTLPDGVYPCRAGNGDMTLVVAGDKIVLWDGGLVGRFRDAFAALVHQVDRLTDIVVTHHDLDHVEGVIKLLLHCSTCGECRSRISGAKLWMRSMIKFERPEGKFRGFKHEHDVLDLAKQLGLAKDLNPKAGTVVVDNDQLELSIISPVEEKLKPAMENWDSAAKKWDAAMQALSKAKTDPSPAELEKANDATKIVASHSITAANVLALVGLLHWKKAGTWMLLTSDAHSRDIVDALGDISGKVFRYVDVPHHGSALNHVSGARSLMSVLRPQIALVSGNDAGHRHPNHDVVLDALQHATTRVEWTYSRQFSDKDCGCGVFNVGALDADMRAKLCAWPAEKVYMHISPSSSKE